MDELFKVLKFLSIARLRLQLHSLVIKLIGTSPESRLSHLMHNGHGQVVRKK